MLISQPFVFFFFSFFYHACTNIVCFCNLQVVTMLTFYAERTETDLRQVWFYVRNFRLDHSESIRRLQVYVPQTFRNVFELTDHFVKSKQLKHWYGICQRSKCKELKISKSMNK